MKALPHQIEKSEELYKVLQEKGLAYLAGQIRSGKTLTSILTAEMSKAKKILVLTKKAAIPGWHKFDDFMTKDYTITNYEQAHKLPKDFDLVIIDEAHNLGTPGRPSKRFKDIRGLSANLPVILLSGTPHAETKASLYYQMQITKYTPFRGFSTFYKFFREYGYEETMRIAGRAIPVYKKTRPHLDKVIAPYFVTMTQKDAGIEHISEDVIHYVELSARTKEYYNILLKDKVATIYGKQVVCDTDMKLRMTLHQLETGHEKFDYIKENFKGKIAVMSHFIDERHRLSVACPHVDVYSSNRNAEGVDLSMYDHFIILSSDYSGSKFIQRRERNVNLNKKEQAVVHHILVKDAISEIVYKTVSKKRSFNNMIFRKEKKELV